MAYQPPNGGQYPPPYHHAGSQPLATSPGGFPHPNPPGYPPGAFPPFNPYQHQQQPNFQGHPSPQMPAYQSPPVPHRSAPPQVSPPYSGVPLQPAPYYPVQNVPQSPPYPYAPYPPQQHPQPQPQPQQPPPQSQLHPQPQLQPQYQRQQQPQQQQLQPQPHPQPHPSQSQQTRPQPQPQPRPLHQQPKQQPQPQQQQQQQQPPRPPLSVPTQSQPRPQSQPQPQPQPQPQSPPAHSQPPRPHYQLQVQPPPIQQQQQHQQPPPPPPPPPPPQPKAVVAGNVHSPECERPQPQVVIPSPSSRGMQSMPAVKKKPATQEQASKKLPVDFQLLLLTLADEYLDAAHSQGTSLAVSKQPGGLEQYFKLVATALGCLEAVLKIKKPKLQPRTEAMLRLRYARILYDETDNDSDAETALSKGIDLCDRNKMFDIKYSMQQLLCRIMFKSNQKAAIKAVDSIISDVEAYRHTGWEYVFRLLRVTLSFTPSSRHDSVAALHNLQKLSSVANRNGENAISVVSAIMEALVHLQQSPSSDSIEHAQRAIGAARTHQLDSDIRDIPQIRTLIQMADICCSLLEYDIGQATQKLQTMQKGMDQNINDPHWRDNGSFSVPLKHASIVESGDILQMKNGSVMLTLSWLPEHDLYALCYFLSSVTLSAKNSQDGHKAEKYLSEGLRMVQNSLKQPQPISESLTSAGSRLQWRRVLYCNMLLQQVFLACSRTDWNLASEMYEKLRQQVPYIDDDASSDTVHCLMEYSRGVIAQGTGDLRGALAIFRQPLFTRDLPSNKASRNNPRRDTSILTGLNTVLILRDPSQPSHEAAHRVLADLEPSCRASPNKYIQAAYSLISATVQTESTIQTKRDLHQALQAAMAISNSQVTCIALTFMSWKYFRGVVGEQSEKSARAARAMAGKADDKLWVSVTEELLADTLDRQGKTGEASTVRAEAEKALESLPSAVKKSNDNPERSQRDNATATKGLAVEI